MHKCLLSKIVLHSSQLMLQHTFYDITFGVKQQVMANMAIPIDCVIDKPRRVTRVTNSPSMSCPLRCEVWWKWSLDPEVWWEWHAEEGEEEAADKVAAAAASDEEGEGEEEEDINAEVTKQRKAAQLARIGIRFQAREDAKVSHAVDCMSGSCCS